MLGVGIFFFPLEIVAVGADRGRRLPRPADEGG